MGWADVHLRGPGEERRAAVGDGVAAGRGPADARGADGNGVEGKLPVRPVRLPPPPRPAHLGPRCRCLGTASGPQARRPAGPQAQAAAAAIGADKYTAYDPVDCR